MALLNNDKMAMEMDMVAASKDMVKSDVVQEEAASMDNNVGHAYGMAWEAWEASGMVGEASEMVGEASEMVGEASETT